MASLPVILELSLSLPCVFSRRSNCKCAPHCSKKKMISVRWSLILILCLVNHGTVYGGIGLTPWQFFLGNGEDIDRVIPISFKPDEGMRLREKFEKKYGPRGEKLINSFGDGLQVYELQ